MMKGEKALEKVSQSAHRPINDFSKLQLHEVAADELQLLSIILGQTFVTIFVEIDLASDERDKSSVGRAIPDVSQISKLYILAHVSESWSIGALEAFLVKVVV